MNLVQETISKVMIHYGFRHKYEVAKYFGVTPQALSTWLTKGQIPSKHLLKVKSEIHQAEIPISNDPSIDDSKTVIDYLINENVKLKNEIRNLQIEMRQLRVDKTEDELFQRINSKTLILIGRLSDGVITEIGGKWYKTMGYEESELVHHSYDEGFIHPADSAKIKKNQMNILKSRGMKESRFSTIRRWKHGKTGEYILLSMVWYVDVDKDQVEIVAKPIDLTFDGPAHLMN